MKLHLIIILIVVACYASITQAQDAQNPPPPVVHSATLKWTASNQQVNYRVWRSNTLNGTYTQIANGIIVLTYKDTKVTAGHTYYYKVDCRNPVTNLVSGYSNKAKAVIP